LLRVPLRRREDGQADDRRQRRSERAEDRREVAHHERRCSDPGATALIAARLDNPLTRAVGRLPATVRTKLVLAFLAIAVLLVAVALLGLRVLGQSNARAESLRALQVRAAAYQELETDSTQMRQLLGLCAGGADAAKWSNGGRPAKDTTKQCLRE